MVRMLLMVFCLVVSRCKYFQRVAEFNDAAMTYLLPSSKLEPAVFGDKAMTYKRLTQSAACGCGQSKFNVDGVPIGRFKCHCTICQSLYKKPFVDVVMLWSGAIKLPEYQPFTFRKYRSPPALRRSTCNACGSSVVGLLSLAPFVGLAFVQCSNFSDQSVLPPPSVHIFYHSRVMNVEDNLPKVSGYWASEWAVSKLLVTGRTRQ